MAALPSNISTGIIRISLRTVVLESSANPVPIEMPLTGSVTFTPSPSFFRHVGEGLIFPATPQTVYLDSNGDAEITLMATDDVDISPINWTYKVSFDLSEATMEPFSIGVPSNSDRQLATLTPAPESAGEYWSEDQYLALQSQIEALGYGVPLGGVILHLADTPPASTTGPNNEPVIWISGGSLLDPVPTVPLAPTFNLSARTALIPTVTGVEYQLDTGSGTWLPLSAGTISLTSYAMPFVAKVRAVAIPGYVLTATYLWQALFVDAATFTLWASDTFTGTPGTALGGRVFDMGGGGNGTAPTWSNTGPLNRMAILSNGTAASRDVNNGTERWGGASFSVGADNCRVEIDVTKYIPAHSRALNVTFGMGSGVKLGITNQGANNWQWEISSGPMSPTFTRITPLWKTNATEAMVLGTWKYTWINRVLQLEMPDGSSYTMDWNGYTPNGWSWGQSVAVSVSDYNVDWSESAWPWVDAIRVYR